MSVYVIAKFPFSEKAHKNLWIGPKVMMAMP